MPYIPKEHEKYDVLPWKRKNGGEVFDYPSKLLFHIEEIIGHDLTPYGYESYEEYYKEVDTCVEPFKDDPVVTPFRRWDFLFCFYLQSDCPALTQENLRTV